LVAEGWVQQTEYMGYFVQAWRRCFRLEQPGWERVHIVVDADRGGAVRNVTAVAPEEGDACAVEPGSTPRV